MITLPKIYKPHSRTLWDDFVKEKSITNLQPFDPIPASTVPTTTNPRRAKSLMSGEYNHLVGDDSEQGKEEESIKVTQTFEPRIKEYDAIIESKEILKFMSKNDRLQVPMGHNLIVANSKTKRYQRIHKNGTVIVDKIVHQFVNDILAFILLN